MIKNDKKRIQISLTQEQIQMLERISNLLGLSKSDVIASALVHYVKLCDYTYDKLLEFVKK